MLDFKSTQQEGIQLPRRLIHIALGGVALILFILALFSGKPSDHSHYSANSNTSTSTNIENKNDVGSAPAELSSNTSKSTATDLAAAQAVVQNKTANEAVKEAEKIAKETENTDKDPWTTVKIQQKDTLAKIFARHGFSKKELQNILSADSDKTLKSIQPGQTLKLKVAQDKSVQGLALEISPGNILTVSRNQDKFTVEHKQQPLEKQMAFGKGKIQNSLFGSAKRAGLDPKLINQMVEIFGWNIDFSLDLKPNDTFRVLFEEKYLDGERVETGHILAAEIVNKGKKFQAVRYTDKSGNTGYFSPDGYGMHQAFLRYPLNFTRISSGFGTRNHPILNRMKKHTGVDYSAPHGTPVQATGDAKVIFVGTRGGYGKVVELQHGARYSTLYAHLSKFAKNLKIGTSVKQGQVIGFVGKTGLATGPHLHYEFRIDGIHRNPLTVALPKKSPIPENNKSHFIAHAKEMIRLLDQHDKVNFARNEFPKNE